LPVESARSSQSLQSNTLSSISTLESDENISSLILENLLAYEVKQINIANQNDIVVMNDFFDWRHQLARLAFDIFKEPPYRVGFEEV